MTLAADRVPRDKINDYTEVEAARRRAFARDRTGVELRDAAVYAVQPGSLAGDISLASAVIHGDWVTSHERLGRNWP